MSDRAAQKYLHDNYQLNGGGLAPAGGPVPTGTPHDPRALLLG